VEVIGEVRDLIPAGHLQPARSRRPASRSIGSSRGAGTPVNRPPRRRSAEHREIGRASRRVHQNSPIGSIGPTQSTSSSAHTPSISARPL